MKMDTRDSPDDLRLKEKLQRAVRSQPVPPYLEARIRANLQSGPAARPFWSRQRAALAAVLMLAAGATVAYRLGEPGWTAASQESYIASVSHRVTALMRAGLSDHLQCAYFSKFPKTPPPMEQFIAGMGPGYPALIPVVRRQIPARYRLESAHRCLDRNRTFVHMVLKDGSTLISLVVARKQPGESFKTEGLIPALTQSGLSMYRTGAQRFEIASFESRDHLVYLISDLPQDQNMNHLLAMAPSVQEVLAKIEL